MILLRDPRLPRSAYCSIVEISPASSDLHTSWVAVDYIGIVYACTARVSSSELAHA